MVSRWKISLIVLASLTVTSSAEEQSSASFSECTGPTGIFGSCIPLTKCGGLYDILSEVPLNPSRLKFLQKSTCTFEKSDPWVCCSPDDEKPPSVSVSNKATTIETSTSVSEKTTTGNVVPTMERATSTEKAPTTITALETITITPEPETTVTTTVNEPSGKIETHPNFHLLPQSCGISSMTSVDRIIGGENAGLGTYPWMVLIFFKDPTGKFVAGCGGTLINSQYVLTAAHCVSPPAVPPGFSASHIRLGEYDQRTDPDFENGVWAPKYQEISLEKIIKHEKYNSAKRHDNDIALLRMKKPAQLSSFVAPVCLPYGDILSKHKLENTHTSVAGWGRTSLFSDALSSVLQTVKVPIITQKECNFFINKYKMKNIDYKSQFCAGGEKGKDSCRGDSGGPLLETVYDSKIKSGKTWQFGVVSYGPTECGTVIPAVYTRVSYYMPWILDHLQP